MIDLQIASYLNDTTEGFSVSFYVVDGRGCDMPFQLAGYWKHHVGGGEDGPVLFWSIKSELAIEG